METFTKKYKDTRISITIFYNTAAVSAKNHAAAIAVRRCICYTLYIVIVSLIFVFYRIKE